MRSAPAMGLHQWVRILSNLSGVNAMCIKSKSFLILCLVLLATCFSGCSRASADTVANAATISTEIESPEIKAVLEQISQKPDSANGYVRLASLYIKKARETGDFSINKKADESIDKAIAIAPDDINARKLKASLYLTFHRFDEGLEAGKKLAEELPNDSFVFGVLTDANAELGNYAEAVEAAQKMVDLKPNSSSYARVAHIRSLHGDHKGAVEMYKLAARTADKADKENQSWCLTQLGDEYWRNGKLDAAEKVYDEALRVLPDFPLAVFGKGRVRAAKGDLESALPLISASVERSPHTGSIIYYGDVLRAAGKTEAAERIYALANNAEVLGDVHDAHRVALFWADNDLNIDDAVKVAAADYAQQQDIYAADILAWCLYKAGRFSEAQEKSKEALRISSNDAVLYYHAGMIETALGNRSKAELNLKRALSLNATFDLKQSAIAQAALKEIQTKM